MEVSRADLLVRGGTIIDGTGGEAYRGDVAVVDGRITEIGDLTDATANQKIDAIGAMVAPGFIDTHAHDDRAAVDTPTLDFKASQGVTTVIAGNCGISAAPFSASDVLPDPIGLLGDASQFYPTVADYREALAEARPAVNVGLLAGHGVLRVESLGREYTRPATGAEIDAMGARLRDALDQGALGLSTGLGYPTSQASTTDEIVGLASHISGVENAVYATHIRNESDQVLESLEEAFTIGRRSNLPVVISHLKCAGRQNHGRATETMAAIERAARSHPITLDVYPYTAGSTVLSADHAMDATEVLIAESTPHPEAAGRRLADIADEWAVNELTALERLRPGAGTYEMMADEDLERILQWSGTMVGSDGLPGHKHPHPRLWGTFPRVLARFVREKAMMKLPEAVHRMTALPATTFNLTGRGLVREGYIADLVVFDSDRIADVATYEKPERQAVGIHHVIVNGQPIWSHGSPTSARPGGFLARSE